MWWKGISFADLMYVTKRNMANVVSSMTKHLEQVQSSLAVTDARLKLENIGSEIKNIKKLVWGLDEKMDSMEAKQDYSLQRPSQELVAKDLHGTEWRFRHIYRGQPCRHLLTIGWSAFVNNKKLVSGDAVLFLRGEDGELRLGVRRAAQLKNVKDMAIKNLESNPGNSVGICFNVKNENSKGTFGGAHVILTGGRWNLRVCFCSVD